MSTKSQDPVPSQSVITRPANPMLGIARRIDQVAAGALDLFKQAGSFEAELQVAQTMGDLRLMLTPEVMAPVMALMNSALGFLTDRNPAVTQTDRDGRPIVPYAVDVVRECFIEAKLRGYHTVGNEFNIISGRFYATKNGISRKVTTYPGITDFKDSYEVPRMNSDGSGAIVKARATWKKNGTADSLEAEIPIRVNKMMGADAILGKAERKLLARCLKRVTGEITPEADVTDTDTAIDVSATVQPAPTNEPNFGATPAEQKPKPTGPSSGGLRTVQQELEDTLKAEGVTFAQLVDFADKTGMVDVAVLRKAESFAKLPDGFANRLINAKGGLITALKKGGAK